MMKKRLSRLGVLALGLVISLSAVFVFAAHNSVAEEAQKAAPAYLSDLKPLPESTAYIADKDAEGNPLQTVKMKFDKGVCVTTNSELIYAIDGKYSGLRVALGHSYAYPEFKGKLVFSVLGDGKVLYESKPLSADDTEEIKVDLTDVRNLALRVSGQGGNSQFVIWGEGLLY